MRILKSIILIVSRTRMTNSVCVGCVIVSEENIGRNLRLLIPNGNNQPLDSPFQIEQIYEVSYIRKNDTIPPHTEDVWLVDYKYVRDKYNHVKWIDGLSKCKIEISQEVLLSLFENRLMVVGKSCCIDPEFSSNYSVSFWLNDSELKISLDDDKVYYTYHYEIIIAGKSIQRQIRIPYVGFLKPIDIIPTNSLCRLSLSRPFSSDSDKFPPKCFLQLSGWYDIDEVQIFGFPHFTHIEDLPF